MKKIFFLATVIVTTVIQTIAANASPVLWRSQSGKTRIYNLDNLCYRITDLLNVSSTKGNF